METKYGIQYDPNIQKNIRDVNDVSSYDYLPELERLYYKSHIFGGSHVREARVSNLFDPQNNIILPKQITTPKLLERMFLEILSNAIDNVLKSRRMSVNPGEIEITMTSDTISVKNSGIPIPVGLHKYFILRGELGTAAELIFGVIGAGSNTSESVLKQGGGQNGYGAKLVNVFSQEFNVEICDNIRGFKQEISWSHNMKNKNYVKFTPPDFTLTDNYVNDVDISGRPIRYNLQTMKPRNENERYNGPNSVKITWKQDFRKMGASSYSNDELMLYMRFAIEASFHTKIPIRFNGVLYNYSNVNNFIKLFNTGTKNTPVIHYEWENNIHPNCNPKDIDNLVSTGQLTPVVELIIFDTPDNGQHISYCNGIYNVEGGVHTNVAYQEVLKLIKDVISSLKGFDKSGMDLSKIRIPDLKKHLTVIINFRCNEPVFKGQDKESLSKPTPKINISTESSMRIKKWQVVEKIYTTLYGKTLPSNTNKNSGGRIKTDQNFEEANWIGTNNSKDTVLILCEGDSAGSYVLNWILSTPEKKNKYAILPLRGKLKNITDLSIMEIEQCKEISKLIQYSGLKYNVDYTTKEGVSQLKYGMIYGMTDADSDGSHIQSLIFNVLYRLFPSFIAANRVFYIPTPIIRVINNNETTERIFYNMFDYKKYIQTNDLKSKKIKYIKGLGSNKKEFAREDANVSPIVTATFDQLTSSALDTAFKKGLTAQRKEWIKLWREKIDINIFKSLNNSRYYAADISMYINTKLVEYSIDSFSRALPSYKDGFKKSQRQIMHYLLDNWNFGTSKKKEEKLKEIAGAASLMCKYHHGDLSSTLARMGSNYPGSNNIPLIAQEGSFGTRNKLGADIAADRYVETKPAQIVKHLFSKELYELIDRNVVEDKEVEPKWIPCYLPMHVINGVLGIATAYSTQIVSYHPIDVIHWLKYYITDNNPFPLVPWYKGFTGNLEIEIFKSKNIKDQRILIEGQDEIAYYEGVTLTTTGIYRILNQRKGFFEKKEIDVYDIEVTEIPIDIATSKFRYEVEQNCDKIIDNMTDTDTVHMIIQGWRGEVNDKTLFMKKRVGMTNITLIDDNSFPCSFRNVYEVLKLYADNMIELFIKLKEKRLKEITEQIIYKQKLIKLLTLILEKRFNYVDVEDEEIRRQLIDNDIDYEIYDKLAIKNMSKNGLIKNNNDLNNLINKHKEISETHHLAEWMNALDKLEKLINDDKSFIKLPKHQYNYIFTPIDKLLDGTVKSPFKIKEEVLPISI